HRIHRAEDLFLRDAHRGLHLGEDGRLQEEAVRQRAISAPLAAQNQLGPLLLADCDVFFDALQLLGVDYRSHVRLRIQAVAEAELSRAPNQHLEKPLMDPALKDQAAGCRAALPAGAEGPPKAALER